MLAGLQALSACLRKPIHAAQGQQGAPNYTRGRKDQSGESKRLLVPWETNARK